MTQQPKDEQRVRTFNPNEHVMQLKSREGSKDYLPVQWRLVWFREACPQGTIDTEELEYDLDREVEAEVFVWNPEKRKSEKIVKRAKGYARYRAVVTDGRGGRATGTKSENAANFADFGEKAETGAVGRALANLGYGTQFAPEMNEEHRIVDSPVEASANALQRPTTPQSSQQTNHSPQPPQATPAPSQAQQNALVQEVATEKQVLSIRKLCEHLGKSEPEGLEAMTYAQAKTLIEQLTQEYRQSRSQAQAPAPAPAASVPAQAQPTPDIAVLQKLCHEVLGPGRWAYAKEKLLGKNLPDKDVTEAHRVVLYNRLMEHAARKQGNGSEAA